MKTSLMPQIKLEKKFGQSPVFVASTLLENGGIPPGATSASLLKEAIHVISCGYEDKTEWGKEVYMTASLTFSFHAYCACDLTRLATRLDGFTALLLRIS